jgi:hypothetical protein
MGKINTVQDLINELELIKDKTMPITLYSNYDYERYNDVPIIIVKKLRNEDRVQIAFAQKDENGSYLFKN